MEAAERNKFKDNDGELVTAGIKKSSWGWVCLGKLIVSFVFRNFNIKSDEQVTEFRANPIREQVLESATGAAKFLILCTGKWVSFWIILKMDGESCGSADTIKWVILTNEHLSGLHFQMDAVIYWRSNSREALFGHISASWVVILAESTWLTVGIRRCVVFKRERDLSNINWELEKEMAAVTIRMTGNR